MERVEALTSENKTLREEVDRLKMENSELKQELSVMKAEIIQLRQDVKSYANPLTAREAVRALENYICVDIVGSKKKAKKERVFTVAQANSSQYSRSLHSKLTKDQISLIDFIKDTGNNIAHLQFDKADLLEALEDEDDDEDSKKDKATLVQMLENYCKLDGKPFGVGPFTKI